MRKINIVNKTISFLIILSVFMGLFSISSFAYTANDFSETVYTLTGNERLDIAGIAVTQLKYHEGNNPNQKDGTFLGSYNYTKYSAYSGSDGAWDMRFIVWCARKANISESSGILNSSVESGIGKGSSVVNVFFHQPDYYSPVVGDLVFFNSDYSRGSWDGTATSAGHVGIIYKIYGNAIYTVEGDINNEVTVHQYSYADKSIVGYGEPHYKNSSVPADKSGVYEIANVNGAPVYYSNATKAGSLFPKNKINVDNVSDGKLNFIYNEKLAHISIADAYCMRSIERPVSSITVKDLPSKTSYKVGETLSSAGLVINVSYSDGTNASLSEGFDFSGSTATIGNTTATVSYGGASAAIPIAVTDAAGGGIIPDKAGISVYTLPIKTVYSIGESFSPDGMVLSVRNANGDISYVANGFTTSSDFSSAGIKTVTIKYGSYSTSIKVTVNSANVTVSSIAIATMPAKTAYAIGETLDSTGLSILVINSNGTTETLSDGFIVNTDLTTVGKKTAVVVYGGKFTTYEITVDKALPVTIEIAEMPTKYEYFQGEALVNDGLKINANMSDGTKVPVAVADCTITCDTTRAGNVHAVVNYKDCTAEFVVTILEVKIDKIEVKTMPDRVEYFVNEEFNPKGLILNASYNSGTVDEIVAAVSEDVKYTYDFSHSGKTSVGIAIGERTCSLEIEVLSVSVDKLELVSPANKRVFGLGTELDTSGLVLLATYSNGTTREINNEDFDSECKMSVLGEQTVTITYGGQKYEYPVLISNDPDNESFDMPEEVTVKPESAADDAGNFFTSGSMRFLLILFLILLITGGVVLFIILKKRNDAAELFELSEEMALDEVDNNNDMIEDKEKLDVANVIIDSDSNDRTISLPEIDDLLNNNDVLFDNSASPSTDAVNDDNSEYSSTDVVNDDNSLLSMNEPQKKSMFRRKNKNKSESPSVPIEDPDDDDE